MYVFADFGLYIITTFHYSDIYRGMIKATTAPLMVFGSAPHIAGLNSVPI